MVEKSVGYHYPPLKGFCRVSDTGQPTLAHNFQRCCGRHCEPLSDGGSRGVGSSVGPRAVKTAPGGVFLHQL